MKVNRYDEARDLRSRLKKKVLKEGRKERKKEREKELSCGQARERIESYKQVEEKILPFFHHVCL